LDQFLGGGIRDCGTIYQFVGEPATGKTLAAMKAVKSFVDVGKPVVWFCTEAHFNLEYAKMVGLDIQGKHKDLVFVVEGLVRGEKYLDVLKNLVYNPDTQAPRNQFGLIVVDSWAGLAPTEEVDKTEKEGMGHQTVGRGGAMTSKFFRLIVPCLGNTSLLIINQVRESLDMYATKKPAPGGKAMGFYPYCAVQFSKRNSTRIIEGSGDSKRVVGHTVHLKMDKNKTGAGAFPDAEGEYRVYYDSRGVDNESAILERAREVGLIRQRPGARFIVPEPDGQSEEIHGWPKTLEYIRSNGLSEHIQKMLETLIPDVSDATSSNRSYPADTEDIAMLNGEDLSDG
jgi:RecA/RadA recombinase